MGSGIPEKILWAQRHAGMGAQTSGCEVWSSREMDTTLDAIRLMRGGRERAVEQTEAPSPWFSALASCGLGAESSFLPLCLWGPSCVL